MVRYSDCRRVHRVRRGEVEEAVQQVVHTERRRRLVAEGRSSSRASTGYQGTSLIAEELGL